MRHRLIVLWLYYRTPEFTVTQPRKVAGWRSVVGDTVNLTGVQYKL